MEALLALLNQYGVGIVIIATLLFNIDKIGAALERVAGKVLPSWAEERRLRIEAQREALRYERETRRENQENTVLILKEMLVAMRQNMADQSADYKKALSEAHIERQRCQFELVQVVARYEQHDAAFLEAIRDVSSVLQEQSRVLNRVAVRVGVYDPANGTD